MNTITEYANRINRLEYELNDALTELGYTNHVLTEFANGVRDLLSRILPNDTCPICGLRDGQHIIMCDFGTIEEYAKSYSEPRQWATKG